MADTILHIAPTPFFSDRGCHIRIEGIVRCLHQLGFENIVCTYHHGRDVEGVITKRIRPIRAYTETQAGPSKYKPWADVKLFFLAIRVYAKLRPKVIHAHLHEGLLIAVIIKLVFFWRRTPIVGDMQGSFTGELRSYGSFAKHRWLESISRIFEHLILRTANLIICSSGQAFEIFRSEFNMSDATLTLVADGADEIAQISERQKGQLRQDLAIDDNVPLVLYSGALIDSKGLQELKQLMLSVAPQDCHFLVIGYPENNLVSFLKTNQLETKCSLTGRVAFEQLPSYLQIADIAIDPKADSAGEASGKMLNYLAAGLPVVAFASNNNRHFLGSHALLAEDLEGLQSILLRYLQDPELRQQVGKQNRQRFLTSFTWDESKHQLGQAYKKLRLGSSN